eukprot:8062614-Pyramimonas_sp.AAC.1
MPLPGWVAPIAKGPPPRVLPNDVLLPALPLTPCLPCRPTPRAPLRRVSWCLRIFLHRVIQVDVPTRGQYLMWRVPAREVPPKCVSIHLGRH